MSQFISQPAPDVVDNLTTNDSTKALSAAQGKALNDNLINIDNGTYDISIAMLVAQDGYARGHHTFVNKTKSKTVIINSANFTGVTGDYKSKITSAVNTTRLFIYSNDSTFADMCKQRPLVLNITVS